MFMYSYHQEAIVGKCEAASQILSPLEGRKSHFKTARYAVLTGRATTPILPQPRALNHGPDAPARRRQEGHAIMASARFLNLALALACAVLVTSTAPALALEECRLLRQPDIEGDRIVFVYGGDL